jgi:hypothetical protein
LPVPLCRGCFCCCNQQGVAAADDSWQDLDHGESLSSQRHSRRRIHKVARVSEIKGREELHETLCVFGFTDSIHIFFRWDLNKDGYGWSRFVCWSIFFFFFFIVIILQDCVLTKRYKDSKDYAGVLQLGLW